MYEEIKRLLLDAHLTLDRYGLVPYTSGNVSSRVGEYVVIKPSGIPYSKLRDQDMVIVDLDGRVVEGDRKPSVDTATHLHIFRNADWAKSVIHTHSTFATVWAILEKPIPVLCTAHADVFGEDIPITEYAPVGSEAIGKAALKAVGKSGSVLLRKHGVLVIGDSIDDAVKKAVYLEEAARISYYAFSRDNPVPLEKNEVDKLFDQYHSKYGQK